MCAIAPAWRSADTVSPPPATLLSFPAWVAAATAFAMATVPASNGAVSNAPTGPFQTSRRALAISDAKAAALAGPADPNRPFNGLAKIAALGIKVSRHCTFHGLALNVAMDLEPFRRINPCGYEGLETTSLDKLGVSTDWPTAAGR